MPFTFFTKALEHQYISWNISRFIGISAKMCNSGTPVRQMPGSAKHRKLTLCGENGVNSYHLLTAFLHLSQS